MTTRPFRFGLTATAMTSRREWQDNARQLVDWGFAVLTVMDHIGAPTGIWAPLASAHAAAPSLRLGTLVLNNDLWNPAVLAREAISTDLLTDGRLELGIGAGWSVTDYSGSGIARAEPGVRIGRLAETLQILRRAFDGETVTFSGKHFQLDGGKPWPAPVQPRLPILVGGGSPRVLRIAARHADIVSIHRNMQHGSAASWAGEAEDLGPYPDAVAKRIAVVREAAGARFDAIELHSLILKAVVTTDRAGALAELAATMSVPVAVLQQSANVLIGTPEQMVEDLVDRRRRWGISYWTLTPGNDVAAFAPVVRALAGS